MHKWTLSLTCPLVALYSFSNSANANQDNIPTQADLPLVQRCYAHVPRVTAEPKNQNKLPVNVDADTVSGTQSKVIFEGNVIAEQGIITLISDYADYDRITEEIFAVGNVYYKDGQISVKGDRLNAQMGAKTATAFDGKYQLHGQGGRGIAAQMDVLDNNNYQLEDSTYTSCPPGDNTWQVKATTFKIDKEEEIATAYNATLWLKDVPIFYFPYMNYPIGDKRKSGLLIPSVSSSSDNGFTYEQPIYWNIAPNQDATLTVKTMSKRGTHLLGEYRYLLPGHTGKVNAEYLSNDKQRKDENNNSLDRYLFSWKHNGALSKNLRLSADYSKVSDDHYFTDLGSSAGARTDNQLLQTAKLSYLEKNWNASMEVRDFQVLGGEAPHTVLPKLAFNGYYPTGWNNLQADLYTELSKFDNKDERVYTGTRFHFEPKVTLPLYNQSAFLNTELKYMLTTYKQDIPEKDKVKESWYSDLDEDVTRALPQFKVDTGMEFERNANLFGDAYTQTLTPRAQYLYVPYKDQSNIGLYDTAALQLDYYGLFRDRRYSGYDRIADANQLTLGATTGFLDDDGQQKFRLALGQVFFFEPSKVKLPSESGIQIASKSAVVAETDINFDDNWYFHGGIEYDTKEKYTKRFNSSIERRWGWNKLVQLNYRFIALPKENGQSISAKDAVNQVGSKIAWPITDQWQVVSSYYYDLENSRPFEALIGVKYESCCWAISVMYDKHIKTTFGSPSDWAKNYQTASGIKVQFELKGLAGFGTGASSSLSQGLFNYGRPFYLK